MKILKASENGINVIAKYDKYYSNDDYQMYFNTESGFELIRGINGKPDPFCLDMPALLDVGIMGHCKNKCDICYQGHDKENHMELDNFKFIVDQCHSHTNQIALGGRGDPNHHPNFKEIVEYCRSKQVVPNYTTSGIDLTDEQIEISKLCGAVAVSDYSKDFTYDAIRRFQTAGIKTNIHFVFTCKSAFKAFSFLKGHNPWNDNVDLDKLNAVIFLLFKPVGKGSLHEELRPSKDQLQTFSDLALNNKAISKVGMDSCLANHIEVPKNMEFFITTCEAARQSAYISPSMEMIPCSFMDKGYSANLQKYEFGRRTLFSVWKLFDTFQQVRKKLKLNPKKCPLGY
jgi:hypothetical protein